MITKKLCLQSAFLIYHRILINIKLFILELTRASKLIEYLLYNKIYNNIKYNPLISYFKLILKRLILILLKKESFPRRPYFLIRILIP
jgi:hypothetical protein